MVFDKTVYIYTDGACLGNPGPGGYGVIVRYKNIIKEFSEGFTDTTNNRMELTAAIVGLAHLKEPCNVLLYSDSKYVVEAMEKGWAKKWKQNGWRKSNKAPALNSDLWEKLLVLSDAHNVKYVWVKGHDGHTENERCDELASSAAKKIKNRE
ncbi:MAG: ribonuclease HI [Bacteroidales bacterium]|nr:ribonuclease HI [Bacteroidales bacterium]